MRTLPQIWTSRYQAQDAIVASGLLPVRTSRGHPRFKLAYELKETLPVAYPAAELLDAKVDEEEFRERYMDALSRQHARLVDDLGYISQRNGGRGLVLCCFEDLKKAGAYCHRTILAEYLTETAGIHVRELDASRPVRLAAPREEDLAESTVMALARIVADVAIRKTRAAAAERAAKPGA